MYASTIIMKRQKTNNDENGEHEKGLGGAATAGEPAVYFSGKKHEHNNSGSNDEEEKRKIRKQSGEQKLRKGEVCFNDDFTLSTYIAVKTNNANGSDDKNAASVGLLNQKAAEKVSNKKLVLCFFQKYRFVCLFSQPITSLYYEIVHPECSKST